VAPHKVTRNRSIRDISEMTAKGLVRVRARHWSGSARLAPAYGRLSRGTGRSTSPAVNCGLVEVTGSKVRNLPCFFHDGSEPMLIKFDRTVGQAGSALWMPAQAPTIKGHGLRYRPVR